MEAVPKLSPASSTPEEGNLAGGFCYTLEKAVRKLPAVGNTPEDGNHTGGLCYTL